MYLFLCFAVTQRFAFVSILSLSRLLQCITHISTFHSCSSPAIIVIPNAPPALFFLRLLDCVTHHHDDEAIFPPVRASSHLYFGPSQCVTLIHIYPSSRPLSPRLLSLLLCVSGIRECVIPYAALVGDGGSR